MNDREKLLDVLGVLYPIYVGCTGYSLSSCGRYSCTPHENFIKLLKIYGVSTKEFQNATGYLEYGNGRWWKQEGGGK